MTEKDIFEIIKNISIFKNLELKQIQILYKQFTRKRIKKNTLLFKENDNGQEMFIILSGVIEIFKEYNGKQKTLILLKETDFFGEISVLTSLPRTASVKSVTDSEILILNQKSLLDLLKSNHTFSLNIIKSISEKLISANNEINLLTFKNVQGRVASQLTILSKKFGRKTEDGIVITLKTPHKLIGDIVGVPRETITRALNQFKNEKSIEIKKQHILIKDIEKLLAWA